MTLGKMESQQTIYEYEYCVTSGSRGIYLCKTNKSVENLLKQLKRVMKIKYKIISHMSLLCHRKTLVKKAILFVYIFFSCCRFLPLGPLTPLQHHTRTLRTSVFENIVLFLFGVHSTLHVHNS